MDSNEHRVGAIASRDAGRAESVAEEYGIPRSYGSYDDLLADSDLDAVYVPLPNALYESAALEAPVAVEEVRGLGNEKR
ncbi:Gfo/Idh/MocA family oxidoreductase [Natronosalvus halobius]|uniref:Gfo/Idh/MocA family oxidoreductase n=1 Tax=Natronosalvus halobius TaxID=2953746 RepID=UPI00273A6062|nr:Gfo/Idh/MocA family oxidoreductase [Natronosalvus halobius]